MIILVDKELQLFKFFTNKTYIRVLEGNEKLVERKEHPNNSGSQFQWLLANFIVVHKKVNLLNGANS